LKVTTIGRQAGKTDRRGVVDQLQRRLLRERQYIGSSLCQKRLARLRSCATRRSRDALSSGAGEPPKVSQVFHPSGSFARQTPCSPSDQYSPACPRSETGNPICGPMPAMRERKPSRSERAEVVGNLVEEVAGEPELEPLAERERPQRVEDTLER